MRVVAALVMCGVEYTHAKNMPLSEAGLFFDETAKLKNPEKKSTEGTGRVFKVRPKA